MTCRVISQHIELPIYDAIESWCDWHDVISACDESTPLDKITVLINCVGGRCDIGKAIFRAIKKCKADVDVHVMYPSYSMGAILALAGKNLTLEPGSFLMFHNYSGGAGGKGDAMLQQIQNDDKSLKHMMLDACYPFLSKVEINQIFRDQDVYIHWDDPTLQERINRHFFPENKIKKVKKSVI